MLIELRSLLRRPAYVIIAGCLLALMTNGYRVGGTEAGTGVTLQSLVGYWLKAQIGIILAVVLATGSWSHDDQEATVEHLLASYPRSSLRRVTSRTGARLLAAAPLWALAFDGSFLLRRAAQVTGQDGLLHLVTSPPEALYNNQALVVLAAAAIPGIALALTAAEFIGYLASARSAIWAVGVLLVLPDALGKIGNPLLSPLGYGLPVTNTHLIDGAAHPVLGPTLSLDPCLYDLARSMPGSGHHHRHRLGRRLPAQTTPYPQDEIHGRPARAVSDGSTRAVQNRAPARNTVNAIPNTPAGITTAS